jgi:hypothetical protein
VTKDIPVKKISIFGVLFLAGGTPFLSADWDLNPFKPRVQTFAPHQRARPATPGAHGGLAAGIECPVMPIFRE